MAWQRCKCRDNVVTVEWSGENNPRGTVRKVAYKYIEIEWDDQATRSALHPADCFRVSLAK